jgi:hypothetical protein
MHGRRVLATAVVVAAAGALAAGLCGCGENHQEVEKKIHNFTTPERMPQGPAFGQNTANAGGPSGPQGLVGNTSFGAPRSGNTSFGR